jgi:hypothetical protein
MPIKCYSYFVFWITLAKLQEIKDWSPDVAIEKLWSSLCRLIILYFPKGTLVTLHMHLEHIPRWIILYALSDMVQGYNTESLTLDEVGTVFGEFHTPCMSKTNFVDFEKGSCIAVSTKDIIRPYQTLHNSPMFSFKIPDCKNLGNIKSFWLTKNWNILYLWAR